MITSLNNEKIKNLAKLKASKERKKNNMFIVEGPHLVKEAKMRGLLIEAYTTSDKYEGELVSPEVMKKLSSTDTPAPQIGICRFIEQSEISNCVLILDDIQDPGNLGTLLRSAKAFGFNTIFLSDKTVDLYNEKVIRSSQGAIFKLNYIFGDKLDFIKKLSQTHKIYSTNVVNGITPDKIVQSSNYALILGNEGNGVSNEINALKLDNLYINIIDTESLNVGVAGAILMYEISKKVHF